MNQQTSLRKHLIRGASGSLVLKIANTALALLMAVVLARVLGVENFGIYAYCLSVAQILTIPAMLGGQQLLVREVAAYQTKGEYHFLRGLLTRFRQASFLASVVLALAAAGTGYLVYQDSHMLVPFLVATAIVPLHTAMQLQGAALRGLRHVLLGQAALTFRPALVIAIVGGLFWLSGQSLGAEVALAAQLAGTALLVYITFTLLHRLLPSEAKNTQPGYETSRWIKSALPFMFAAGFHIFNIEIPVFLIGILGEPEEAGFFRIAQKGAWLIPFGLQAVNMAIGPTIAKNFAENNKYNIQRIINKSIMAACIFAVPLGALLMLGGKWIIPFVFGQEYFLAYIPLIILCIGQLFSACMGSVGLVLNMAGYEKITATAIGFSAIISIILHIIFIPMLGPSGAALSTSFNVIFVNTLLVIQAYKKTGIICTVMPIKLYTKFVK